MIKAMGHVCTVTTVTCEHAGSYCYIQIIVIIDSF